MAYCVGSLRSVLNLDFVVNLYKSERMLFVLFAIAFLSFCCALGCVVLCLICALLGSYLLICGEYELSTMLVTYDLGWLPRGLLGTIFSVFGDENVAQVIGVFNNLVLLMFLLLLMVVFIYFLKIDKKFSFISFIFLSWPSMFIFGFSLEQPRADGLMYLLFLVCVLIAVKWPKWLIPAVICTSVFMIFAHEGWVFLFLPFLLFLIWSFVGFRQAAMTGFVLLIPFLLVEFLPHVGVDAVVDYLVKRKQNIGWYECRHDSLSLWADIKTETESMAFFQYGSVPSLFNLIYVSQHLYSVESVAWLFYGGLKWLLVSVPQLILCYLTIDYKFGKRLALCVLPFLVLMLCTQLDWVRFIPMYVFGFGATVFALWARKYVESPFDKLWECET